MTRLLPGMCLLLLFLATVGCEGEGGGSSVAAGTALLERGKLKDAVAAFEKALADNRAAGKAGPAEAHHGIAVANELAARFSPAAEHYAAAAKLEPKKAAPRLGLARVLAMQGDEAKARTELDQALAISPEDPFGLLLAYAMINTPQQLQQSQRALDKLHRGADARGASMAEVHLALADLYTRAGAHDKARREQEHAAGGKLAGYHLAVTMATLLRRHGHLPGAERHVQFVQKEMPDHMGSALLLAEVAMELKHLQVAEQALAKVPKDNSAGGPALMVHARLALAKGDTAGAKSLARQALKQLPPEAMPTRGAPLRLLLAQALASEENYPEALAELSKLLADTPDFMRARLMHADMRMRAGQGDQAIAELQALIKKQPEAAGAYRLLGKAQLAGQDAVGAAETLETLTKLAPSEGEPLVLLGRAQAAQKNFDEARKSFEAAMALDAENVEALRALARLDGQALGQEAAEARLVAQLGKHPKSATLMLELARYYAAIDRDEKALAFFQQAIAAAPDRTAIWFEVANFHLKVKRPTRARQALEQALDRDPSQINGWMQLAHLQTGAGEAAKAKQSYDKALTLNPKFVPALNNLAMLSIDQLEDPEAALKLAMAAKAAAPTSAAVTDTLGWVHQRRGESDKALPLLSESTPKLGSPDALFHLGMAQIAVGQTNEGKANLRKALDKASHFEGANQARTALSAP